MRTPDHDLAAEFCTLVGVSDLLSYLGARETDGSGAVRARLKARRRFMQGMQNNPKYREEALFLIRHFQALDGVLDDLGSYMSDAQERTESEHLPVLEMSIRTMLATGAPIADERLATLRKGALDLGLRETTFERVLAKVTDERAAQDAPTMPRLNAPKDLQNSDPMPLSGETPTARATWEEGRQAELQVEGEHARSLRIPRTPSPDNAFLLDTIVVRNTGEDPMPGQITSSQEWLVVDPSRLDPAAAEQRISVQVDPADVPPNADIATVRVETDHGQRQKILYQVKRGPSWALVGGIMAGGLVLVSVAVGLWLTS